jgi:hypothetical protein
LAMRAVMSMRPLGWNMTSGRRELGSSDVMRR